MYFFKDQKLKCECPTLLNKFAKLVPMFKMIVTITEFYVRGDLYIALEWMGAEENEF